MAGSFLEKFFSERGNFDVKGNNEADVRCPFPHGKDGHLEKNQSAHVNVVKGVFHCKTCAAEGKFSEGGLSETNFFAKIHNISYEEAIQMLAELYGKKNQGVNLETATQNLQENADLLDFLRNTRGLKDETITEYQLGSASKLTVDYPVFIYGDLLDIRSYNPTWKEDGSPKIKSQQGARPLLFPFDHWNKEKDIKPTIITAGENDTLLARQEGFNALTTTMGEGNFPKSFVKMFKGMSVYICYDCDEAGIMGAKKVAFRLTEAGADVKIMDLGLTGEKTDKDTTDFYNLDPATFQQRFQSKMDTATAYTAEDLKEVKDLVYPLINLWEVERGEHTGQRRSSRVLNMGKVDRVMQMPSAVEWKCNRPDPENATCLGCGMNRKEGYWTLNESNLDTVLELVE